MAKVIDLPKRLTAAQKRSTTTLYLAGPFEENDGNPGQSWRDQVIAACSDLDIVILDPRSPRWAEHKTGSAERRGMYDWQCSSAFDADVVIVWVPAGSHAPTALMIVGYLSAKRGNAKRGSSTIVGGDGWDGLVRLFAQNQRLFPMGNSLEEVIRVARLGLAESIAAKRRSSG